MVSCPKIMNIVSHGSIGILTKIHDFIMVLVNFISYKGPLPIHLFKVSNLVRTTTTWEDPLECPIIGHNWIEVRTFRMQILIGCFNLPVLQIWWGIDAEWTTSKDHKPLVIPAKDLRVTEILVLKRILRPVSNHLVIFLPSSTLVLTIGDFDPLTITIWSDNSYQTTFRRFEKARAIGTINHDRAWEHVTCCIWIEGYRLLIPMKQVSASRMGPVHWTPFGVIVKLIEEMITSLVEDQAIRVISPAILNRIMILITIKFVVIHIITLPAVDIDAVGQGHRSAKRIGHTTFNGKVIGTDSHWQLRNICVNISLGIFNLNDSIWTMLSDVKAYCLSIVSHILNMKWFFGEELGLFFNGTCLWGHHKIVNQRKTGSIKINIAGIFENDIGIPIKKSKVTFWKDLRLTLVTFLKNSITCTCDKHIIDIVR